MRQFHLTNQAAFSLLVFFLSIALTSVLLEGNSVNAQTITSTWDMSSGNWSDATRWDTADFPQNGGGSEYSAIVGGGELTLTEGVNINDLTIGDSNVFLGGFQLELESGSSFVANTSFENGTLKANGDLGVSFLILEAASLQVGNGGKVTIADEEIILVNQASTISVEVGGALEMGVGFFFSDGSASSFNNAGTFTKTGVGFSDVDLDFTNSGVVNANDGSLAFYRGGTHTGTFNGNGLGVVDFAGSTVELESSSVLTGNVNFSGLANVASSNSLAASEVFGTVNFNADTTIGQLKLEGGIIGGTGVVTTTGTSSINGGTLQGTTLRSNGDLTLTNSGLNLDGATLEFGSGTTTTLADDTLIQAENGSNISVFSGATLNLGQGASLFVADAGNSFNNAGIVNKNGARLATIDSDFNNSGVVNVDNGMLGLYGAGTSTGTFNGNGSGVVDFAGSTIELESSSVLTGNVNFSGLANVASSNSLTASEVFGTVNFNADTTIGQLKLEGGIIGGTGVVTTTGTSSLNGGTLQGTTLRSNGNLTLTDFGLNLDGAMLEFGSGTTTAVADDTFIQAENGSSVSVISGAIVNLGEDVSFFVADVGNSLSNAGVFNIDGTGTTTIDLDFDNSGDVNVNAGTLNLASFNQSAGEIHLSGSTVNTLNAFDLAGGEISGSGDLSAVEFKVAGSISPGNSAGQLNFTGDLELSSSAIMLMEIGGLVQGADFDFIQVDGDIDLGGNLVLSLINGFESTIVVGDEFTLLSATNLSGSFANVADGGSLDLGNVTFDVFYGSGASPNDVILQTTFVAVPEPTSFLICTMAGIGCFARRRRSSNAA